MVHIAVLLMVKNEKKRLHVSLESVKDFADSLVIFDTGSTDNTIEICKEFSEKYNIPLTGVLHVGAHDCQEIVIYRDSLNIAPENMIWIDALDVKVKQNIEKGILNAYKAVITDKDDDIVLFKAANNEQSSSIYSFKKHIKFIFILLKK